MAITFVSGSARSGTTTLALDSSTANFAVVNTGSWPSQATTITEGGGFSNTWTALASINAASHTQRFFYSFLTSTGAGHTFAHNGGAPYITVALFSGVPTDAVIIDIKQAATGSPGTVTPTSNGSLILSAAVNSSGSVGGPTGGLTIADAIIVGSSNVGGGLAYLVQTVSAPITPVWTASGATAATTIVIFSPPPPPILDVRQSQNVVETIEDVSVTVRGSQFVIEAAHPVTLVVRNSQDIVEVLADVPAGVWQTQNVIEIISTNLEQGGIYFINPVKFHDTYYAADRKIPNPRVKLAYFGE